MTRQAELNLVQQTQSRHPRLARKLVRERCGRNSTDQKADADRHAAGEQVRRRALDAVRCVHQGALRVFQRPLAAGCPEARLGVELASFQQEGLHEAIRLIDRHGGVIVSDAVGLGKTYIGMGLLEHYVLGKRRKGLHPEGAGRLPGATARPGVGTKAERVRHQSRGRFRRKRSAARTSTGKPTTATTWCWWTKATTSATRRPGATEPDEVAGDGQAGQSRSS